MIKTTMKGFVIVILILMVISCHQKEEKQQSQKEIGMEKQQELKTYTLKNKHGNKVKITNFGASVMMIEVADKNGKKGNVVLGYDTPQEYINGNPYFGAIIGRYCNRIAKGAFTIDGKKFKLARNNGENHLHGGPGGFHNVIWQSKKIEGSNGDAVELKYVSPDREEGYPGKLTVNVMYTWTHDNELIIEYKANANKKTIVNLTHHSFFNLKDGGKSKITGHHLSINAERFLPVDEGLIPTGEFSPVEGTPMDFITIRPIGDSINSGFLQLKYGRGYDHNYVLNECNDSLLLAAQVHEPVSGRVMEIYTDQPGLQFYSGNFLDGTDTGHHGAVYNYRTAFCLETQHFPDSPNHPEFPSTVLDSGEVYTQKTVYKFSIKK